MLLLAQPGGQRIHRQLRRMSRTLRQASDRGGQAGKTQISRFLHSLSGYQFGQRRGAGHRCNAPFRLESDFPDPSRFDREGQPEHVPAHWILNLSDCVRRCNLARVARILKVIKQLGGIHGCNSNRKQGLVSRAFDPAIQESQVRKAVRPDLSEAEGCPVERNSTACQAAKNSRMRAPPGKSGASAPRKRSEINAGFSPGGHSSIADRLSSHPPGRTGWILGGAALCRCDEVARCRWGFSP